MNTVIFNKKIISNPKEARQLEYDVAQTGNKLEKWFLRYSKPVMLEVHIARENESEYRLSYAVNLKSGNLQISETGESLLELSQKLQKELKTALKRQLGKEKALHKRNLKKQNRIAFESLEELKVIHKEEKKIDFQKILNANLPGIRNYVLRRYRDAENNKLIPQNQYEAQDILDEVYLHLYNEFDKHPEEVFRFKVWLYREVNQILKTIINEAAFKEENFVSVEEELFEINKSMDEKYSVDGDGDFVMMDELDDPSYAKYSEIPDDISNEEENEILENIDHSLKREKLTHNILKELSTISFLERAIYDLYCMDDVNQEQIALIKDLPVTKVEQVIKKIDHLLNSKIPKWINEE